MKSMQTPAAREALESAGFEVATSTPEQMAARFRDTTAGWIRLLKELEAQLRMGACGRAAIESTIRSQPAASRCRRQDWTRLPLLRAEAGQSAASERDRSVVAESRSVPAPPSIWARLIDRLLKELRHPPLQVELWTGEVRPVAIERFGGHLNVLSVSGLAPAAAG